MNRDLYRDDNRGLSLVELIIVIAIMAVLLGLFGLSLSMLIGSDAKQAATKMDAQLNDIKTGAMSRASEYMVIRYIDVAESGLSDEDMARLGVDKSGYYAEKRIDTITNDPSKVTGSDPDSVKLSYGGAEYTRIASKKVTVEIGGVEIKTDGTNGVKIEYDRRTGRLYDAIPVAYTTANKVLTASEEVTDAPGFTEGTGAELTSMTFKAGFRTYEIDFESATGRHKIVN